MNIVKSGLFAYTLAALSCAAGTTRPETWFHIIGGNASKEGLAADIAAVVEKGRPTSIRVEVVSTWYNALVEDAKLPEKDSRTWMKFGPKADAQYHEAGLVGPVTIGYRDRTDILRTTLYPPALHLQFNALSRRGYACISDN